MVISKIENGVYNLIRNTKEVIKETHLAKNVSYLINLQGIFFFHDLIVQGLKFIHILSLDNVLSSTLHRSHLQLTNVRTWFINFQLMLEFSPKPPK